MFCVWNCLGVDRFCSVPYGWMLYWNKWMQRDHSKISKTIKWNSVSSPICPSFSGWWSRIVADCWMCHAKTLDIHPLINHHDKPCFLPWLGKSTVLGLWNTQPTCCSGLVVWNMNFIFHVIYGIILPHLTHIFQRGRYTTKQCCLPRIDGAPWQMGDGSRRQQCCRSVLFLLRLILAVRKNILSRKVGTGF